MSNFAIRPDKCATLPENESIVQQMYSEGVYCSKIRLTSVVRMNRTASTNEELVALYLVRSCKSTEKFA